jgi:hypothetical protein
MATADAAGHQPEDPLAWERERRPLAGWSALLAALLTLGGNVIVSVALRDLPQAEDRVVTLPQALGDVAAGRDVPPGRVAAQVEYLADHAAGPIAGGVLVALGTLLLFLPLAYLFRATRARNPRLGQWLLVLLAVGAVLNGVGNGVANLARSLGAQDFADAADRSNSAAAEAISGGAPLIGAALGQAGALALGFGLVITALNAMRAGLLTRFMGILGIIVGVTFVLPLDQIGIIRSFWFAALGALILGRWPSGTPRAWSVAEPVPWPSQQEVREQRAAAARARGGGGRGERGRKEPTRARAESDEAERPGATGGPVAPRPEPRAAQPHSASKKKRRRRRP